MLRYELEMEAEEKAEDFKSLIFANDRKLYTDLFGTETTKEVEGLPVVGDEQLVQPESIEELKSMVNSMQRSGVLGTDALHDTGE